MLGEKLWSRTRTRKKTFRRRARREHFGELVQLDGSFHDWFEGRGPVGCLISIIDDATGRSLGRFSKEETTHDITHRRLQNRTLHTINQDPRRSHLT